MKKFCLSLLMLCVVTVMAVAQEPPPPGGGGGGGGGGTGGTEIENLTFTEHEQAWLVWTAKTMAESEMADQRAITAGQYPGARYSRVESIISEGYNGSWYDIWHRIVVSQRDTWKQFHDLDYFYVDVPESTTNPPTTTLPTAAQIQAAADIESDRVGDDASVPDAHITHTKYTEGESNQPSTPFMIPHPNGIERWWFKGVNIHFWELDDLPQGG